MTLLPLHRIWRRSRRALRHLASRSLGVPLHEEATAAQDDRPSREVVAEIARLRLRNLTTRDSIVDPDGETVVCVKTHGERVRVVWAALESIAAGEGRPRRFLLVLDEPDLGAPLPAPLRRLQRRGLEIVAADPRLKMYGKFWPYVISEERHAISLTIADDDALYPRRWLRELVDAYRERPSLIHAFRAHEVVCADGALVPYHLWIPATGTTASFAHFATGVSGRIMPPELLERLRDEGEAFLERAPRADDVWIHAVAVRAGIRTAQVGERSENYPFVPGTQATGLYLTNVAGRGNDGQLAASLEDTDIACICADFAVIQERRAS